MKLLRRSLCLLAILHCSYAPPVTPDKDNEKDSDIKDNLEEYMDYHRYLREVVETLENDPEFRERLEKADEQDIRSGKIAEQLDFVNHNVRTKLDEIKRRELERLRHLATKQYELTNNLDQPGAVSSHDHLDHANPHTFEIQDLMKLIVKTTADLEVADKERKEQFKEYEMQKEFEKKQKIEHLDEEHKKQYLETVKSEEEAKKHHKPIHHPGSKQQLEEVWEKTDHQDQQFNAKAFFMMHDVDGNGVWDADEVKALFIKELDKIYGPNGPNKDLRERAEEMERMREHVFQENDKNKDGLIDFHEFMMETQKENFNKDEGWKTLDDENQVYTQQEYEEFQRRRMEELTYLQQRGLVDANFQPIPGADHQIHQALSELYAHKKNQHLQHGNQYPPQGYPQQGQHLPQYAPGQHPPQAQYHPGQHPAQGQYPPGQHPAQGQYHPGQNPPQGQYNQGYQQVPAQNFQQPPNQGYPPQGQGNMNQPPQHHAPVQQNQNQAQSPPTNQGQPPQNQGQVPPNQGQAPPNQGQAQLNQGHPQINQGQQLNQGQVQPNQGQPQLNQGQPSQNQAIPQQSQGQPNTVQAQPNQGQPTQPGQNQQYQAGQASLNQH